MNNTLMKIVGVALLAMGMVGGLSGSTWAQEKQAESPTEDAPKEATRAIDVADGALQFKVPAAWKSVKPKINFIEAEFKIPREEGDPADGRMTIMGAGGSVEQNIQRWIDQFVQPDGKPSDEAAKIKKVEMNGLTIHIVDISGTFLEGSGGPFGPKTERPGYRMLAAIIETPDNGNYFVKFYGPAKTVAVNGDRFRRMIRSTSLVD